MRTARWLSLLALLALGAALLCLDVGEPWTGSYDANGALFSTVARNYLRYGLAATRGGQVVSGGQLEAGRLRFYTHHPPGLPLAMAASFAVFGEHEWSARLVPILFTLGAAALLWLVAKELGGPLAGFLAALVFVVQPMVAFYGRMPDHEAPAAFFALALAALYLGWRRGQGRGWVAAMSVMAFVGVWFAWVVAVVPWLLLAVGGLAQGRRAKRLFVPAVVSLVALGLVFAHLASVAGGAGELWGALSHRLGSAAADRGAAGTFGWGAWLGRQAGYFDTTFCLAALVGFGAWVLGLGRQRGEGTRLVAALAVWALLNVVGLRQGAWIHLYYQFYLAVPLALGAGFALAALVRRSSGRRAWAVAALALAVAIVGEGWWKLGRIRAVSFPDAEAQVRLAGAVRRYAGPSERVLVVWGRASSFRPLTYYADRDIVVVPSRAAAARRRREERFDVLVEMFGPSAKSAGFVRLRGGARSAPVRAPAR